MGTGGLTAEPGPVKNLSTKNSSFRLKDWQERSGLAWTCGIVQLCLQRKEQRLGVTLSKDTEHTGQVQLGSRVVLAHPFERN